MTTNQTSRQKPDPLFHILMDDEARGLTLIHAAPIRTAEDFRRVRAEVAGGAARDAALNSRRR